MIKKRYIVLLSTLFFIIGCSDMGGPIILQPQMDWSPSALDFGVTTVGHDQTGVITVTNQGEGLLQGEIILDQDSSSFSLLSSNNFSIEAGDTSTILIQFLPTAAAAYSGSLIINSDDPGNAEVTIPLSGTGVAQRVPAIQLSASSLAFGSILSGSASSKQFSIVSSGTDTLVVDSMVIADASYSHDQMTPISIAPGNFVSVSVTFEPMTAGDHSTQIMVYSNVSTSPHQIAVSGEAEAPVGYASSIQPIFNDNCIGCHGGNGGLSLGSYAQLMSGSNSGAVVIPGDAANSRIIQRLKGIGGSRMPLNNPALPDATIQLIETWIDQGALDN
ncbi:MAG: choice-of-anchor D domain-containing protein [Candidatus Marinimicrobia bacterium]|nr:choice-of-anchor D domain-containing protein [Candidatus Neomarinimicrobiota bacterium]MCF7851068.1 choice-of-anchor D domain-containing protein [Candidatus Neomarinimicrobiota bacterium]MCF7904038.1 choice-of-anchor D domain-containing protein [Candidatus Neomarinimicrobiota bacterium]